MRKAIDITFSILYIGLCISYVVLLHIRSKHAVTMECVDKLHHKNICMVIYSTNNIFYSVPVTKDECDKITIGKHYKVNVWQRLTN